MVTLTRICTLLNKADRDLFLYGLDMGDLVQLHAEPSKIDPDKEISKKIVVGYNYDEDIKQGWLSRGWYFKYIDSKALAVYICRVAQGASLYHWARFHKIFCDGSVCIVHEKYLYPRDWQYDPSCPPEIIKKAYNMWYSGSM